MAKKMKLSNISLGLAVAASGLIGTSAIASNAEAATLFFAEPGLSLVSDSFEFQLILPSKGDYKSALFVANAANANVQNLFQETSFGDNSGFVSTSNVFSLSSWASGNGTFSLGLSSVGSDGIKPTVYSKDMNPFQFKLTGNADGWYTFGVEDTRVGGDMDSNDVRFSVRAVPVPVPAIVPGIALAAAFFGSKALKRNKKVANESVA